MSDLGAAPEPADGLARALTTYMGGPMTPSADLTNLDPAYQNRTGGINVRQWYFQLRTELGCSAEDPGTRACSVDEPTILFARH